MDIMFRLDLQKIIDDFGLDKKRVAAKLFPENTHPDKAINRVLLSESLLNTDQIGRLALMAGVQIGDLFEDSAWKARSTKNRLIFNRDEYEAVLCTDTWVTNIYEKGDIFYESALISKFITIGQYIEELDLLIINRKKNDAT